MNLVTAVDIPDYDFRFNYKQKYLFVGSCFSENISNKLLRYGFGIQSNPFGILYNPLSIADSLSYVIENKSIEESDLVYNQELWHSIYHHGSFSSPQKDRCLQKCNTKIAESHEFLKSADVLLITFGSAYVHKLKSLQKIAGNCHKLPAKDFDKFLLEVEDISVVYDKFFAQLHRFNPKLHIQFTVSPIRHFRDGLHENQLSKSVLHLLIAKLLKKNPNTSYFPAYEIMMDELRDYRFYDRDLVHPNSISIDYIWERFSKAVFDSETLKVIEEVEQLQRMIEHRPLYAETQAWKAHQERTKQLFKKITQLYPALNLKIGSEI